MSTRACIQVNIILMVLPPYNEDINSCNGHAGFKTKAKIHNKKKWNGMEWQCHQIDILFHSVQSRKEKSIQKTESGINTSMT